MAALSTVFIFGHDVRCVTVRDDATRSSPVFYYARFAIGVFQVTAVTLIQEWTDRKYYSRVFALYFLATSGMMLPSVFVSGFLLSVSSFQVTVTIMGSILSVAGILGVCLFPSIGKSNNRKENAS